MLVRHKKSDITYLHDLGSDWMKKETKKLGRPPSQIEVFWETHTKNGSDGVFIDGKSQEVDRAYSSAITEKYDSTSDTQLILDVNKWVTVSGGLTKGRVYGFGSSNIAKFQILGSFTSYMCTSTYHGSSSQTMVPLDQFTS
ncbi:hypothetical protein GH714_032962 [Hevea brasiliensis]|uniref:Uncharacterized protein n=1 Tax=Hevea brasiliensis TaxID=3981 RepID=A0A6A6KBU2_HEVBR|nr:hypothetical protein GH714_032962 [Hevea brasiliensis]